MVPNVVVGADGVVEVRGDFALSAGAWGVFDDVRLVAATDAVPVDTSALAAALARPTAVDRDAVHGCLARHARRGGRDRRGRARGLARDAGDVIETAKVVEAVKKLKPLK